MKEVYRIRLYDLEGFITEPDLYFESLEAAEALINEFKKLRPEVTLNYELAGLRIFSKDETIKVLEELA